MPYAPSIEEKFEAQDADSLRPLIVTDGEQATYRGEDVDNVTVMVVGAQGYALSCPILLAMNFVGRIKSGLTSSHVLSSTPLTQEVATVSTVAGQANFISFV